MTEKIGNIIYWDLKEEGLAITNLESCKHQISKSGYNDTVSMTNVTIEDLDLISQSIQMHFGFKNELNGIKQRLENLEKLLIESFEQIKQVVK